ncbi:uncharacterized protein LOC116297157 [Actinia tenebrosa]|uniref:Uncharacterized protein LOC116297157 n=1 Tax=Actinia tenebrosa TaxID=6105 RepID=A0A6P8HXU3_ACTTE|nr:uncharacterized protein LOC116297157 [Actinia tenebrosa]XP_031561185.1 uncharacterized protein LOC116297157 [Actinia tenebrosa]XP_031561186.1 uncharacterized protein LOC116297157 [Actinia tenebrosa]
MMQTKAEKNGRVVIVVSVGVIIIGLACMVAGVVLMVKYSKSQNIDSSSNRDPYTKEARKSGLDVLLNKLQDTHFRLNPDRIYKKEGVTDQEIRLKYRPRDLSWERLKHVADEARKLLVEFKELRMSRNKLSIREKRALELAKFWIKHVFPYGVPYGYDYYVADWLLGPDVFCWMPVCHVAESFHNTILKLKPYSLEDMEVVRERLVDVNRTFAQYVENMKMGIKIGMVRNVEGCKAGLDGIKDQYLEISLHGKQGVLNCTKLLPKNFFDEFLSEVEGKPEVLESWQKKYGKSMNGSLKEYLVQYVGKPIADMFRYLEVDYSQYCPPGDVLTGYSNLPLSHVYKNGTKIGRTTQRLPTGELIDGKKSFRVILDYFTTIDISPKETNNIGYSLIKEVYPKILQIAREVTEEKDNETAAEEKFKKRINEDDMYFNEEEIPASESDERAHKLCRTDEGAKKHCPVRWKAIQNWFTYSRQVMAALDAKSISLFHFAGKKHTTPNCPVRLTADYNPSSAAQAYEPSNDVCSDAAMYSIPFFQKKPGPKYEEWTVCAHETRPGHHLQAQGFSERFSAADNGIMKSLSSFMYFLGFQEGWALYAEDPLIATDTDTYKDFPFRRYGTLKWQVLQAIRLIADSAFHDIGNFSREDALKLIEKYAWETGDFPQKEITRYQSLPGQATAYVVGKLRIMKLRKLAEKRLGEKFNLKDFHFQLLQHGPSPFSFLEEMITLYIDCVLGSRVEGCQEILNPPKTSKKIHSTEQMPIEDTNARLSYFRRR